jgi:hypothetical protein
LLKRMQELQQLREQQQHWRRLRRSYPTPEAKSQAVMSVQGQIAQTSSADGSRGGTGQRNVQGAPAATWSIPRREVKGESAVARYKTMFRSLTNVRDSHSSVYANVCAASSVSYWPGERSSTPAQALLTIIIRSE